MDPAERRKHFGQEDHVRYYGKDFGERVERAGFQVTVVPFGKQLDEKVVKNYGIPVDENVYLCRKAK